MRLRVVDLETTGTIPDEILEIGIVDVVATETGWRAEPPCSRLFRPRGAISFHAMAIHHLTPSDFPDDLPRAEVAVLKTYLASFPAADVMVAHNADFEKRRLPQSVVGDLPWLCTVKAARQAWPEAPGYANQVLRYWRGLRLDPRLAMPPHRAAPDAWVTAHILMDLLSRHSVETLLNPAVPDVLPFGRHRGLAWADTPTSYLMWMTRQPEMDRGLVERAIRTLAARGEIEPGAPAPSGAVKPAAVTERVEKRRAGR